MKCYIDDFVEDLNYRQVILYIGNVDLDNLRSKMKSDNMGHMNHLATVTANHLMYVENCDLQDVDTWHGEYDRNILRALQKIGKHLESIDKKLSISLEKVNYDDKEKCIEEDDGDG